MSLITLGFFELLCYFSFFPLLGKVFTYTSKEEGNMEGDDFGNWLKGNMEGEGFGNWLKAKCSRCSNRYKYELIFFFFFFFALCILSFNTKGN